MDLNNINAIAEQLSLSSYDHVKLIMDHFKESDQSQLDNKYKNHTTRELKKDLKHLKENNAPLCETKYVSYLLRPKIKTSHSITSASLNHDSLISKNFWGYVKRVLQKRSSLIPTFTLQHCTQYFRKMSSDTLPDKQFHIPSWISQFEPPTHRFNLQPPSYQKVTAVVRRMKSSLSPSPLDLISNICFKRCPYLRSLLTEIIRIIWKTGSIPSTWKNACTILIHKKGSTDDPSSVRPISLEFVMLKIFTSTLHDSMYDFLKQNNHIECQIQKGFISKISGTLEHTSIMGHIINKARIKQHSLIVTLLDLINAFGEVHHNLISSVLTNHHTPDGIQFW